jgi:hypothetical protein
MRAMPDHEHDWALKGGRPQFCRVCATPAPALGICGASSTNVCVRPLGHDAPCSYNDASVEARNLRERLKLWEAIDAGKIDAVNELQADVIALRDLVAEWLDVDSLEPDQQALMRKVGWNG